MRRRTSACALLTLLLQAMGGVHAAELTGRISLFGSAAHAVAGDTGHVGSGHETLTSDQQSLRLMLEDTRDDAEWSVHVKSARRYVRGIPFTTSHSSGLFRYRSGAGNWLNRHDADRSTRIGYEIDRAVYKRRFGQIMLGIGRQPIDWGSGRFWQPMNVFGAFTPTDLDTDFKPGIDAGVLEWFPSAFSSLTAVYVLSPRHSPTIQDSFAIHYRSQAGERSEIALLAGRVIGNNVIGGSFESDWAGLGWRIEGVHYTLKNTRERSTFWIAGADYQLDDGTLLSAEWHDNSRGATQEASLSAQQANVLIINGLQPHLSRRVLALSAARDLTPLLHGTYKLLISPLKNEGGQPAMALLHQISLVYSVSNESDLLLSLLYASGKGLTTQAQPRSEFGHLPASVTVRWRHYF